MFTRYVALWTHSTGALQAPQARNAFNARHKRQFPIFAEQSKGSPPVYQPYYTGLQPPLFDVTISLHMHFTSTCNSKLEIFVRCGTNTLIGKAWSCTIIGQARALKANASAAREAIAKLVFADAEFWEGIKQAFHFKPT